MSLSSDPISFSPVDNAIVLSPMAISCSPSEFMELLLSLGLSTDRRLDVWLARFDAQDRLEEAEKEARRAKEEAMEERRPEPEIRHPFLPHVLLKCRYCKSAKGIVKDRAVKPGGINEGRSFFRCRKCSHPQYHRGGFICWADDEGVFERNGRCGCGIFLRKQMAYFPKPAGREFLACAVGKCDFFEWYVGMGDHDCEHEDGGNPYECYCPCSRLFN